MSEFFPSEEKKVPISVPSASPYFTLFFNRLVRQCGQDRKWGSNTAADKQLRALLQGFKGPYQKKFPAETNGIIAALIQDEQRVSQPYLIALANILRNNLCNRPCMKTLRILPF